MNFNLVLNILDPGSRRDDKTFFNKLLNPHQLRPTKLTAVVELGTGFNGLTSDYAFLSSL